MDLAIESDVYQPTTSADGTYEDYLPSTSHFKNGLRCPCGSRKDHIFENRCSFSTHIKSKTHQKWLSDLNTNKMNYFTECEKLKEVVNSQKIIIAQLEKDLFLRLKTIEYLTQQLINRDAAISSISSTTTNLLELD